MILLRLAREMDASDHRWCRNRRGLRSRQQRLRVAARAPVRIRRLSTWGRRFA